MTQELTKPIHPALNTTTAQAESVRKYLDASSAANTRRAYSGAMAGKTGAHALKVRKFVAFADYCADHGYTPHPARAEVVVLYLTHLADAGAKVATIEQRRAAIASAHRGQVNPCADDRVKEAMKGIRRKLGTQVKPKAALSPDELRQIVASLPDDLRGIRDRALLLMGWQGAFRRSELVALIVADVDTRAGKLTITISRSKTDQDGQGQYKVLPELPDKSLCALTAYRAWLSAAEIRTGPVFRSIDRWGHVRAGQMNGQEVARIVQGACKRAGIDPQRFAGHSLRSGYVTAATNAGANDGDIMEQTGHRSSATLRRYKQMAGRGAQRATLAALGMTEK